MEPHILSWSLVMFIFMTMFLIARMAESDDEE